jgi:hypothetical protein
MIKTKAPVLFKSFKTKQARVFYSPQAPASDVLFAPQAPASVTHDPTGFCYRAIACGANG